MMLGMSQTTLADAIGLTFQQIQKYEKGTNRIGASRLQQIAHVLQVPVPFFFEGAPNVPDRRPVEIANVSLGASIFVGATAMLKGVRARKDDPTTT
jgi:transcriptional regulator with XRE-family HTH domain